MYQLAQTDVRMRACDRTNKKNCYRPFSPLPSKAPADGSISVGQH